VAKLGEETLALFGRGTLPVPTALRETYGALVALDAGKPPEAGGQSARASKGP